MKIKEYLAKKTPSISFEFFPPKTDEGFRNLMETVSQLKQLNPAYVSITYGAGGSTRQKTVELVSKIKKETGIESAAHLTCVGHTKDEIKNVLEELAQAGIENIIALRGDPPKGQAEFKPNPQGFKFATELVSFIKKGYLFSIGVAGYPEKHIEAPDFESDLRHLKEKVDAGADFVVTQLFFDNKAYFSYVEKVRSLGVKVPILAGLMPITDTEQIKRFSGMCGATLPVELLRKLEKAGGNKEEVVGIGIDHAAAQARELLTKGAPGIHFYTLNKSHSTREIFQTLKNEGLVK